VLVGESMPRSGRIGELSGAGSASTRPGRSRARSFCSVRTRCMSGISGTITTNNTEISQKSSA
jgi:hypothetical protein